MPHLWQTKGLANLARGLDLSPLSVVGPILEADILLITHIVLVLNLSVTIGFNVTRHCFEKPIVCG